MAQQLDQKQGWYYIKASDFPTIQINGQNVPNPNFQNSSTVGFLLNAATGAIQLTGTGPAGPTGPSGTSNVPWVDIQNYGGIPKPQASINVNTTFHSTAGSPDITVGSALPYFVNGAGICLWKAGAATTQTTPSAPTVTAPPINGTQTIRYQIVGVDSLSGLTTASAIGTITTAPAVFSPKPIAISSATAVGGVVTLNFASPLNTTVVAGMTIHVVGITGAGATWCGIWTIATAPSTSQVTIAVAGATGTGTVTGATGRLSNTALITAISRDANGNITVTTAEPHNFNVGTSAQPTIVILEGILTYDLNGHFKITSTPTANSFVCSGTGNLLAETGSLNVNGGLALDFGGSISAASATVWEYVQVACPALSGTTVQYYIYSDSANPGGSLALVGKTIWGESHFIDWGPNYGGGFLAPAYVPATPPSGAQNQLFSTTILSGGGTSNLVLAANVPSGVTSGICMYDDAPCLTAANAALPTYGGQVLLSPPQTVNSIALPMYIFNSPITVPSQREIVVASALWVNETIYLDSYVSVVGSRASDYTLPNAFAATGNPIIYGLGNPMFQFGTGPQASGLNIDGLSIFCTLNAINGQVGLSLFNGFYVQISNCTFLSSESLSGGTCIPLLFNGNCVSIWMENIDFTGYGAYSNDQFVGQSCWGPIVGNVVFRASDNSIAAFYPPDRVSWVGVNTSAGRGIQVDFQYGTQSSSNAWYFSHLWQQAPTTPTFMFMGPQNALWNITIEDINNDSESCAVLANWNASMYNVILRNCLTTNPVTPWITGSAITNLAVDGFPYAVGQSNSKGPAVPFSFTTGSGTTDTVTIPGLYTVLTATSHVTFSPTNAAAATMVSTAPGIYISSKSGDTVVFTHGSALAGATFDIICTLN